LTNPPGYAVPALVAEVSRLMVEHPMGDAIVEEVDGRRIQVDGHWLVDFASCNYLGLDLDLEVIAQVPAYLARWGTHPSWARAIASPEPYRRVETTVSELLGVEDVLAFPTLTHTHNGVLPALAGEGTVLVDIRARRTIYDAAGMAAARGATVRRFRAGDVEHARRLLRGAGRGPRLVCMDGINSMTGNPPDLPAFAALAREHDALLYVDDAHGFGVAASATATTRPPTAAAATRSCAGRARDTTTSCSRPASPRPTRHCWPS
jgi:8-amino-7-oxononanoate synthase